MEEVSFVTDTYKVSEMECSWSGLFDDTEKKSLEGGFLLAGFISIILGLWLNMSILLTELSLDRSYRNLANFTTAALLRRIFPLITYLPFFKLVESSNEFDPRRCEFLAFLETFLAVFEVKWLTHVCIERYVVTKYITNGWPIQKYHYTLFQCLCLFFASLYSIPPLMGVGRYGLDFSCSFCTFDMILPDSWKRYIILMIFLLRSIKPAMVMLMMLTWARILERKFVCSEETQKQVKFTKNVIMVTLVTQLCWSPIALIRGVVIFSQLFYSRPVVSASVFYIKWSMWIHWMAPAFTTLVLLVTDCRIRENMLRSNSIKVDEDLNRKKEI